MPAKTPEGRKLTGQKAASARWGIPIEVLQSRSPADRERERKREWCKNNVVKRREYFRRYREAHPELKEYHAKYFQEHGNKPITEEQKVKRRARDAGNRAILRLKEKDWRGRNPEKARAIEQRTRTKNRAKKRLRDEDYRRQKPEIHKASIARAKAAKPEMYKQIAVKSALTRRARKKQLVVERVSLKAIRLRDGDCCHLCGATVQDRERSFDHLIPVVRSGAHAEWNLMVAHLKCNKSRGTKQILSPETKEAAEAYIERSNAAA